MNRTGNGDPPDVLARFREFRRTGAAAVRDRLVTEHMSLAQACARRFADRGEPLDDLVQVAMLGLVKAVDRFDPEQGVPFAGFAVPTVTGELRRHFRDATWAVHVPRRAKDLHVRIPRVVERMTADGSRAPTVAELATEMGVGIDDVVAALDAGAAYRTSPLDSPDHGGDILERDARRAAGPAPLDRVLLAELLERLPERERKIVWLRFFEDLSQSEIAERVGTSQVHVSRLLRRSLRELRAAAGVPLDPAEGDSRDGG